MSLSELQIICASLSSPAKTTEDSLTPADKRDLVFGTACLYVLTTCVVHLTYTIGQQNLKPPTNPPNCPNSQTQQP